MKFETRIGGRAGSLSTEGNRLTYLAGEGASITADFSCERTREGEYSILLNGKSYSVIVLPGGVSVNGIVLSAEVFDPRSLRGRRSGETEGGRKTIAALMPGRVVRVLVEVGETVEAGQGLVVVEAMKMQNEMKAPRSGIIKQIKIEGGMAVATGDVLLIME